MHFPFFYVFFSYVKKSSYSFHWEFSLSKKRFCSNQSLVLLHWCFLCRSNKSVREWGASISEKLEGVAYTPDAIQQDLTRRNAGKNVPPHFYQMISAAVSEVACVNMCVHACVCEPQLTFFQIICQNQMLKKCLKLFSSKERDEKCL